jgi:hypothetical protein
MEFVNKYVAPYGGKTNLGCDYYKYWADALQKQLHFVDAPLFDRGRMPLETWVDEWTSLNDGKLTWSGVLPVVI